jgi:hypothetical protein
MTEHPSTHQTGPGRHRMDRFHTAHPGRWLGVPVPLGLVLAAVLGSLPVVLTIIGIGAPEEHWTQRAVAAIALGWAAPLATVAALTVIGVVRQRVAERRALRAHVASIALLASRAQTYIDQGHPEPLCAAAFDFAVYATTPTTHASVKLWYREAQQWFRDHAADTGLPGPKDID